MEQYTAPEKKLYFHKDDLSLYGKVVIIREEDDYTIDDFILLNKEEYLALIEEQESEMG